ncbi:nucleotidyltransferase domain-containing protein [Planctomycetota bacterium]
MLHRDDYTAAIDDLVALCHGLSHVEALVAVYIAGSVARGDFTAGRSDIDAYVVCTDAVEEVRRELSAGIAAIVSQRLPELAALVAEPISLAITTMEEIQLGHSFLGVGFEYHNFTTTAKLILGTDVRSHIRKPSRQEERLTARTALKAICEDHSPRTGDIVGESDVYQLFSTVFRAAAIFLCGQGTYVSGKQETTTALVKRFAGQDERLCSLVQSAFESWREWGARPLTAGQHRCLSASCEEFIRCLSRHAL